jgi:hypothetical protein
MKRDFIIIQLEGVMVLRRIEWGNGQPCPALMLKAPPAVGA